MRVGFVGWRGMVGSVLMQRMQAEHDFDTIEPLFFSTSSPGGKAPSLGKPAGVLRDANAPEAFRGLDAIVTCQGGDWTTAMYPRIREAGFKACACVTHAARFASLFGSMLAAIP